MKIGLAINELEIERETEKAYGIKVKDFFTGRALGLIWVPKSVVRDGVVPSWVIEDRFAKMVAEAITTGRRSPDPAIIRKGEDR